MAGVAGLEPVTSAVTGQRSNQLSYTPAKGRQTVRSVRPAVNCHLPDFALLWPFFILQFGGIRLALAPYATLPMANH